MSVIWRLLLLPKVSLNNYCLCTAGGRYSQTHQRFSLCHLFPPKNNQRPREGASYETGGVVTLARPWGYNLTFEIYNRAPEWKLSLWPSHCLKQEVNFKNIDLLSQCIMSCNIWHVCFLTFVHLTNSTGAISMRDPNSDLTSFQALESTFEIAVLLLRYLQFFL